MRVKKIVLATCLAAGLAGWLAVAEDPEEAAVRVHADILEMEHALLDAVRAFLRDEMPAAKSAMDRLAKGTRILKAEERELVGSGMVSYSEAFQVTLGEAREYAARGDAEKSWKRFVLIQTACRTCHELHANPEPPQYGPLRAPKRKGQEP